jgi:hypothetical protein
MICASQPLILWESPTVQNGGSVRDYQELLAPLAIRAMAEQAVVRPVSLCIVSAWA